MKKANANENDLLEATCRAYDRRAGEPLDLSRKEIVTNIAGAIGITPKQLRKIWSASPKEFRLGIDQANGFAAVELRLRLTLKWKKV